MRKVAIIFSVVVLILGVLAIPAWAGKGNPNTERQGEESGQAKQAGPGGPNYGKSTPQPPIPIVQTPTAPKSESGGGVYRVLLPVVANRVVKNRVVEKSVHTLIEWK